MNARVACAVLVAYVALLPAAVGAQTPPQPYRGRETWYEFLLRQFNPTNFNCGAWLEERRQAFLAASVKTPYFWYSFWATAGLLFMLLAYAKLQLDHWRSMRITAEMLADVHNHDQYSRQAAREAIEKHNRHIEQCNRAFEAAVSADGRPGWGGTELESMRTELQRVATQLDATTQERNKLQEELRQKALVVSDLSLRLDALAKKVNGQGDSRPGTASQPPANSGGDGAQLVGHINRLQEELYAERQKNRRLKGA
jgi:hypothetical protein